MALSKDEWLFVFIEPQQNKPVTHILQVVTLLVILANRQSLWPKLFRELQPNASHTRALSTHQLLIDEQANPGLTQC